MADAQFTELSIEQGAKKQHDSNYKPLYSDIDLSFAEHPNTSDLKKITGYVCIKQSMRNILQTRKFERLGHPEIGSNLQDLLFDPMSIITETRLKQSIENTMSTLEPRAIIRDIQVTSEDDRNRYRVKIIFTMMGSQNSETFEQFLYR